MKLVHGRTFDLMLRDPTIDDQTTISMIECLLQVAQTIAYAHEQNVVHRDLKPQNVMLVRFGKVQVMDWGMAKDIGDHQEVGADFAYLPDCPENDTQADYGFTRAGDILGTPGYMAPEQARGELDQIDKRSDVFAIGAMLFQILSGHRLSDYGSTGQVIADRASGELQPVFEAPDQIESHRELGVLCRRCLSPERNDGPSDAAQIAESINDYLTSRQQRLNHLEIERAEQQVRTAEPLNR